jgi:hypothetical protein
MPHAVEVHVVRGNLADWTIEEVIHVKRASGRYALVA